ncbi:putative M18 family aminopeptidase 1 [Desulfovibrionales bacterium]
MTTPQLEYKPINCWEIYTEPEQQSAIDNLAHRYVAFLSECKTERLTVARVRELAMIAGYTEAFDTHKDRVLRVFRDKTILLARRGWRSLSEGFRLLGAHSDAPRLDLKQRPLQEQCQVGQAKTHYYGGIRKYQWLARPLALHGVVVKDDGRIIAIHLGEEKHDPVFTIADLLPHLACKQVEQKLADAFDAEKLNLVLGHAPCLDVTETKGMEKKYKSETAGKNAKNGNDLVKQRILKILYERYGIVEEDLYSAELQVVPAGPARFVGLDSSLIGGYGQDDRICVFTGLEALLTSTAPNHTQLVIFWDKEEIGSEGSTGAQSMFLEYGIDDLITIWDPEVQKSQALITTKAISADVHGALDPDWQELHEKLNAARMGYGPCFCKFTGHRGKVGANDAHPEYVGWLRGLLNRHGIPWQIAELGKVDLGGGGTIAKYLAKYGLDIIDCGPPLLSMHSPFELASKVDLYATMLAYKAFLES